MSFTSNIVEIDVAKGMVKCEGPTSELGNLKLSLIDVVNNQPLALNYDIHVFEKISIAIDPPLLIHNETMKILLKSDYNLNKIMDVNISCLLNNRTLGEFKIVNKLSHCLFHPLAFSSSANHL